MSSAEFLTSEQWKRVSSRSKTRVFFPSLPFNLGKSRFLPMMQLGSVKDVQDLSISSEMVKCSIAR